MSVEFPQINHYVVETGELN